MGDVPEDYVIVPTDRFNELLRNERILYALEAAGVDNWEWYGDALEEFWEEEDEDD